MLTNIMRRYFRLPMWIAAALLISAAQVSVAATCEYTVVEDSQQSFVAKIRITNNSRTAINGWSLEWGYEQAARITQYWDSRISGQNPYRAQHLSRNKVIKPGQFMEFWIEGTKPAGVAASAPLLTGAVCDKPAATSSANPLSSRASASSVSPASVSSAKSAFAISVSSVRSLSSALSSRQSSAISSSPAPRSLSSSSSSSATSRVLSSALSSSSSARPVASSSASSQGFIPIPLTAKIDRVQPMTGIVFWTSNSTALNGLKDSVQLEYTYLTYSQIVNSKGVYDWTALEQVLTAVAARGHQAIIRFHDTYPGETQVSIPDYIVKSAGYRNLIAKVEGQNTFIPDWSNQQLRDFMLEFYQTLAQRYDQDKRLAFLQVGFGSYAEFHLYDGNVSMGYNFPDKLFQADFFTALATAFSQTAWSVSIDAADSTYSVFANNSPLNNYSFGLFDDSFMHETHSYDDREYNRSSWLYFGANRYQSSPAGGEFNYYSDYDQQHVLDFPNGPYGKPFEDFASQYHISYMIGNDQFQYQTPARIKAASLATGYAFVITDFAASATQVKVVVKNRGVAPLYYPAYPAINGVRANSSLKGLLPQSSRTFLFDKPAGKITLTIESDRLVNGQVIQFDADL